MSFSDCQLNQAPSRHCDDHFAVRAFKKEAIRWPATLGNCATAALMTVLLFGGCQDSKITPVAKDTAADRHKASETFTEVAELWGVSFTVSPRRPELYQLPDIIGSGCAILDFDRNGHLDVMLISEDSTDASAVFFSQVSSERFTECAASIGLSEASGRGIAIGDCNNDGWPDIYCTAAGEDQLWINIDGTSFKNVTAESGISNERWGTSACWFDFDRDGWLDLFVTNYVQYSKRSCTRLGGGDPDFCAPSLFGTTRDSLFRNVTEQSRDGTVKFVDVTESMGISSGRSAGLGVTATDIDGDNWIDLYVASDQHPNRLWMNRQTHFVDEATLRGCDTDFQGRAQASMGIALGDVSHDGHEDVVVSHLDAESHAVYSRGDDGLFRDLARESGIRDLTRPFTGFGVCIADFNFDGANELLTVNGRVKRQGSGVADAEDFWQPYRQPIQLIEENLVSGGRQSTELLEGRKALARGLAIGDLDRDGDPDVICSTLGEATMILRNDYDASERGFTLRFVDPQLSGRNCPGVKLTIVSNARSAHLTFQPCQSYMSTHAAELYLPICQESDTMIFDVVWPHGSTLTERFKQTVEPRSQVTLERGAGSILE